MLTIIGFLELYRTPLIHAFVFHGFSMNNGNTQSHAIAVDFA